MKLFSASFWLIEYKKIGGGGFGAGPRVMARRVRTWLTGAHTARVKLLPAEVGAGGARHTLIPQHPDLSGPVAACPWQTWQPPSSLPPPYPSSPAPLLQRHGPQCHGWARDLSSLALLILLCELMLRLRPGTKAVSTN